MKEVEQKKQPLVSLITPVYNAEAYLGACIASVQAQSYPNWEMLLVEDGSADQSWALLKELAAKEPRLRIFKNEQNSGAGASRNKAIAEAKGRYIAFLDADDTWHPDKLAIQIPYMLDNGIAFSHTSYGYTDAAGNRIKDTFHVSNRPIGYHDLLKRTEISCLTAVYDAELIGKFYMSEHRRKQDYALWLSILKSGVKSYPIDQELAWYRQTPGSATSKKWKLISRHIQFLRETQNMNILTALYYTTYWMVNGFLRYYVK